MVMEEEDKTVFYSLFTETAKEQLKKQIYMYMCLDFQQKRGVGTSVLEECLT